MRLVILSKSPFKLDPPQGHCEMERAARTHETPFESGVRGKEAGVGRARERARIRRPSLPSVRVPPAAFPSSPRLPSLPRSTFAGGGTVCAISRGSYVFLRSREWLAIPLQARRVRGRGPESETKYGAGKTL